MLYLYVGCRLYIDPTKADGSHGSLPNLVERGAEDAQLFDLLLTRAALTDRAAAVELGEAVVLRFLSFFLFFAPARWLAALRTLRYHEAVFRTDRAFQPEPEMHRTRYLFVANSLAMPRRRRC